MLFTCVMTCVTKIRGNWSNNAIIVEVIPVFLHRSLNFNRYFNTYKNLLRVVQMLHSLHKTTTTIQKKN